MKIQPPGGIVTLLSILWLIVALFYVYLGIAHGLEAFVVAAVIGVPSLLLWVGSYRAANFLIMCLALTVLVSLGKAGLLFTEDATQQAKIAIAAKILLSAACIPPLWRWSDARNPEAQSGVSEK